jgi:glycosyltransferase involved in cell wall biosynthesis
MDNEAIRHARGELLLWCDSDDILTPEAVGTFLSTWRGLSSDQRKEFVGVTALAATKEGVLANPFPGSEYRDVSWNDLAGLHRVTADMTFLVRTDVMRSNPFPEVDLVVPESVVWNVIGDGKTRFIPKVLRLVEYRAPNAISFSGKMNYNRGRAYAAAVMQRRLLSYSSGRYERMWRLVNFLRYCIHGEIGMAEARRLWADNSPSPSFWSCVPVAHLLALADRLRNKVVRSHREFLANQGSPVSATWLGTEVASQ